MPHSRKGGLAAALLLFALPLVAQPYHLTLEANPAAPFPFLGKFGTVTLDVYPGGVRAETLLMNAFSRNGAAAITVENPLSRIATNEPIAGIAPALRKLGRSDVAEVPAPLLGPELAGKVGSVPARRYRLVYGPAAWIDVWTATAIPPNPQLRTIVEQFVAGLAPGTAAALRSIPGTPLYVELNFRRFHKLPLLRLKSFVPNSDGEEEALRVGRLYFFAR
ncbi:MAG TPA: hypothetical protein VI670_11825 [Thermoanaerobaculia bacterium]|jgi:hypothetical protein